MNSNKIDLGLVSLSMKDRLNNIEGYRKIWEENKKDIKGFFSIVFEYYHVYEVADLLGVSPRFISCMRRKGNPAPIPFYLFLKLMIIKNTLMLEEENIDDIF